MSNFSATKNVYHGHNKLHSLKIIEIVDGTSIIYKGKQNKHKNPLPHSLPCTCTFV
jgi:hypothetical protein